jgi:hypothetical protein
MWHDGYQDLRSGVEERVCCSTVQHKGGDRDGGGLLDWDQAVSHDSGIVGQGRRYGFLSCPPGFAAGRLDDVGRKTDLGHEECGGVTTTTLSQQLAQARFVLLKPPEVILAHAEWRALAT